MTQLPAEGPFHDGSAGFPSAGWVGAADAALTDAHDLPAALGDADLVIAYAVAPSDEQPEGFDYRLEIREGAAHMLVGPGDAPVTLHADLATARAIHDGEISAQDAVIRGDLRIEGNATPLIAGRAALDAVNRVLDDMRALTGPDA